MRRIVAATGTFLAAGAAASILSAGTASAVTVPRPAPRPAPSAPILLATLHLTKTDSSGVTATAELHCMKSAGMGQAYVLATGTVKDPTAACQELVGVDGDFDRLIVHPTWLVPPINEPVSASATGKWNGSAVDWSRAFSNPGALQRVTGDVFGF